MQPDPLPLKDIHLPEAIGWWPPALGWWLVVVLAVLSVVLGYWLYNRLTRKTAIKSAFKMLAAIRQDNSKDNTQKLCEVSLLLRRVALSIRPRAEVAGLTGNAWLVFLDKNMADKPFSTGVGACLKEAPYQPILPYDVDVDVSEVMVLCENWLKVQAKFNHGPSRAAWGDAIRSKTTD